MKLQFLGATKTVTGSKYLLEIDEYRILVDCGLFQGRKELRLRNWEQFPVDPKTIHAVLLTHAHIDHSGYLPVLIKQGFSGPIYSTHATKDLCNILLPDSGHLQEEEARLANKYGYSKHKPALPLYTREDGVHALDNFHTIDFDEPCFYKDKFSFEFRRVGHILGAAAILIKTHNQSILFSGDVGRLDNPIALEPEEVKPSDYMVVESTYGNRLHEKIDPLDQFDQIINRTIQRNGSIIIPAFAVGRSQLVLYYIYELIRTKRIPSIPIFMDSPMAIDATQIFLNHSEDHRLSPEETRKVYTTTKYINDSEDSKTLDARKGPMILISASGMATGGRILHHLKVFLKDTRNTILFAGYQVQGTRGDRLVRGETEIKIHGQMIPVKAEIVCFDNLSAHADYEEILTWLKKCKKAPKKLFITHGEENSANSLKEKIESTLHWKGLIPDYLEEVIL